MGSADGGGGGGEGASTGASTAVVERGVEDVAASLAPTIARGVGSVPPEGSRASRSASIVGSRASGLVGGAKRYIDAGQVRALAVTSATRNAMLPNVPTMREAGLPGYEVVGWMALYGPPKLAPATVDRMVDANRKVLATADFQARLAALGYTAWPASGSELTEHATKERAMWSTVTKGIEID